MNKSIRVWYGALSILPIGSWMLFIIFSPFLQQESSSSGLFTFWDLYPGVFGKITVLMIGVGFVFAIYLAFRVFQNVFVPKERRGLWIFLLIFGNVFFLPIFWVIYLRKGTLPPNQQLPPKSKHGGQA